MSSLNTIFILAVAFVTVFGEAWLDVCRDLLGAQIHLLPALVVYTSLTHGIFTTSLLAICGGLWFDSLSCNPLGISILPLFVIGFLIQLNHDLLLRDHPFAQMVLGFAASVICPLATVFFLLNSGGSPLLGWESIWQFLIMGVAGGLLTPAMFSLFDRINAAINYQPIVQTSFRTDRQRKYSR